MQEDLQEHRVGRHQLTIALRDGVGPATPYSLLLANHIPEIPAATAVDIGTGSGFLAIVARLQGAKTVYLLDTYDKAITLALENAERNHVRDGMIVVPIGGAMIPLPEGERVDVIISNPAQLPLPEPESANSPFYAGLEGRDMIEGVIQEAPERLAKGGRLLMTHNSMADLPRSMRFLESLGLAPRILAETSLAFRPFINRDWLDKIGGVGKDLYEARDGVAYERLYVVEARAG